MRDFRQIPETGNQLIDKLNNLVVNGDGVSDEIRDRAIAIIAKHQA